MHRSWLLLLLLLAACSSVKSPAQPQARLDADSYLRFALSLEAANDLDGATENYEFAHGQYRELGEPDGQLAAKSGLARMAWAKGDLAGFQSILAEMESFSALHGGSLDYLPLLTKLHKLQSERSHAAVSQLAIARSDYPEAINLRLKAIKLQADSYLKQADETQARELRKLAKAQQKGFEKGKNGDSEALSSAWYALGFYYYGTGNIPQAWMWTKKCSDWDFRTGNLNAYAHSLWLLAQVAEADNQYQSALSYYDRAYGIFKGLGDSASLLEIRRERQLNKEKE
ncbi:hypothetical protein MASR1M36_17560 [Candidatus Cloacimonadaceae bacterium]